MRGHADCYDRLECGMKINSGPGGYSNVVHMMDQMKLKKINQSIEIATEEQKIIENDENFSAENFRAKIKSLGKSPGWRKNYLPYCLHFSSSKNS